MSKISRNDPCPCGSGRKYKKCCLAKDDLLESRRRDGERAAQTALAWLDATYPEESALAYQEGFLGDMSEEDLESLDEFPSGLQSMVIINSSEWILADGDLIIDGTRRRVLDLVLGPGGPLLPAQGREWLKALGESPMSMYEAREVKPGEGLRVVDLLDPAAEPFWVRERSGSKCLTRWDVFGARLARQDDAWVFSGAIYPFNRKEGIDCRDDIMGTLESNKPCADDARSIVGTIIIDTWLADLLADRPLPELADAATGEQLLLTTDHYRVTDCQELARILETQEDVDGNREEGWNRFVEMEVGWFRSLASLELKKSDSLEVFCRTPKLADKTRQWLEDIAGGVLRYRIREVVDPRSEKARDAASSPPESPIPQEVQRQIIHEYLAKHYETWPEIPLPALEGKSPLNAVKDKRLRPAVIELLKSIDQLEARRVERTGGEQFDVSFLWERLGVER